MIRILAIVCLLMFGGLSCAAAGSSSYWTVSAPLSLVPADSALYAVTFHVTGAEIVVIKALPAQWTVCTEGDNKGNYAVTFSYCGGDIRDPREQVPLAQFLAALEVRAGTPRNFSGSPEENNSPQDRAKKITLRATLGFTLMTEEKGVFHRYPKTSSIEIPADKMQYVFHDVEVISD
jgi:hypothetical protein